MATELTPRPVQANAGAVVATPATRSDRPAATAPVVGPPVSGPPAPQPEREAPDLQEIQQATARIQEFAQSISRNLSFAVDDGSGKTVIVVSDTQTSEIIRRIPSEEVLHLARTLQELAGDGSDTLGKLLDASA